jgi:hypothetical protein
LKIIVRWGYIFIGICANTPLIKDLMCHIYYNLLGLLNHRGAPGMPGGPGGMTGMPGGSCHIYGRTSEVFKTSASCDTAEVLGRQENLLECLVENLRRDYRAEIYEN